MVDDDERCERSVAFVVVGGAGQSYWNGRGCLWFVCVAAFFCKVSTSHSGAK